MFAIIKTGGKQYIVRPGDKIKVEKLAVPQENEVVFDHVLLVAGDKPEETLIGAPYIKEYTVRGKILGQGKRKKIIVYKYKSKKRYHKKQGHRQLYTEVEIISISSGKEEGAEAKIPIAPVAKKIKKTAKKASSK